MAKISYYLNGDTVMVSIVFNGNRLRMSVDEHTAKWNQKNQLEPTGDSELDFKLQRLRTWLLTELRRADNSDTQHTTDTLRKSLSAYLGFKQVTTNVAANQLEAFIPVYLESAKSDKGRPYAVGTRYLYTETLDMIHRFNAKSPKQFDFTTINERMYDKFVQFMRDDNQRETTIGRHIASLKHVLNVAFDRGLSQCVEQKKKYFKVFMENSDQEVLTLDEIDAIYRFEVTDQRKAYHRDLFVMTFFTGFRFSDWHSYRQENITTIDGIRMLRVATRKTGKVALVPINATVWEILQRLFKSPYPFPVNSEMTRTIRMIVKQIEAFKVKRTRTYTINGAKKTETIERWKMISPHTARRSFCTNLKRAGMSDEDVMQMTAHASAESFRRYVRISAVERAIGAADHPFFKGSMI